MTRPASTLTHLFCCRPGRPVRQLGWLPRLVAVLGAVPVMLLTQAVAAQAGADRKPGQAPSALSWIHVVDSHGISVWNYEMSLDRGGWTSTGKVFWSILIDLGWELYLSGVVIAIWLIDWVLSFSWLTTLVTPVLTVAASLTGIVNRFGLAPALLTVAASMAVLWMAKGKWALGIFELFTSLMISSLAIGVLANPVALVAGPDGMIMRSRDAGLQIANGLAHDGQTGGAADQLRKDTTRLLADTFVRLPAQTLNFGTVLDGGKCQPVYDKVVKGGPYGTGSDIRDAVGACDPTLGKVAANPGPGQAVSAAIISPAALLVLVFAIVLAGAVFLAALFALYQSLKAIVTLVSGLLPGQARGALWHTVADLVMSLVTVVFAIVFLTGYLLLVQAVFLSAAPGDAVMATFFFVDILLVAGLVLFWRGRKSLRRAADRLAQALAGRPGAGPTSLPQRRPFDPAHAYYKARMAATAARGVRHATGTIGSKALDGRDKTFGAVSSAGGAAGRVARWAWNGAGLGGLPYTDGPDRGGAPGGAGAGPTAGPGAGPTAGPGASPAGGAGGPRMPNGAGGAAQRVTSLVRARRSRGGAGGQLVRLGTRAALALASGGTSAVAGAASGALHARTAVTVARAARRAVLARRLAVAARAKPAEPGRGDMPGTAGSPPPAPRSPPPGGRALPPRRAGWSRLVRGGQVVLVAKDPSPSGPAGRPDRASPPGSPPVGSPVRSAPRRAPGDPSREQRLREALEARRARLGFPLARRPRS